MKKITHAPKGYHTITPSLSFQNTEAALDWYKNIFGASERGRIDGPDKKIMHAELLIGDSLIFLAEENPEYKNLSPASTRGNSITLYLYVENVDELIKKAAKNGATIVMEPMDMFYGDRCGSINDPYGYTWVVAARMKDVPEKEMQRMAAEMPVH